MCELVEGCEVVVVNTLRTQTQRTDNVRFNGSWKLVGLCFTLTSCHTETIP